MMWSDNDKAIMVKEILDGATYSAVARGLKYTRNGCIGKANRMKADGSWDRIATELGYKDTRPRVRLKAPLVRKKRAINRGDTQSTPRRAPRVQRTLNEVERDPPMIVEPTETTWLTLDDMPLRGSCRYPVNETYYCGATPRDDKTVYCEHHHSICHTTTVFARKPKEFTLRSPQMHLGRR